MGDTTHRHVQERPESPRRLQQNFRGPHMQTSTRPPPAELPAPDVEDRVRIGLSAISTTLTRFADRIDLLEDRIQRSLDEREAELQDSMLRRLSNLEARIQRSFEEGRVELRNELHQGIQQRMDAEVQQVTDQFLRSFQEEVAKAEARLDASFKQRLDELASFSTPTTTQAEPRITAGEAAAPRAPLQLPLEELTRPSSSSKPPSPVPTRLGFLAAPNTHEPQPTSTMAEGAHSGTPVGPPDHTFILNNLRQHLDEMRRPSIPPFTGPSYLNTEDHPSRMGPNMSSATRGSAVSLMEYDGSFPWRDYKAHLECASLVNRWSEQETAANLVTKLRGPALHFVSALGPSTWTNYHQLMYLLENRFGIKKSEQTALNDLRRRSQRPGERLDVFAMEVQQLTRAAYPDWPDQYITHIALEQFLNGVSDTEVQMAIRISAPTTLTDAANAGQKFLDHRTATRSAQRVLRTSVATLDSERPPDQGAGSAAAADLPKKSGNDPRSA